MCSAILRKEPKKPVTLCFATPDLITDAQVTPRVDSQDWKQSWPIMGLGDGLFIASQVEVAHATR